MKRTFLLAATLFSVMASPAFAHLNPAEHGSFAAGFTHPLSGADHILAMVAVGLWASMLGGRALIAVPLSFVGVMLLGFVAALGGLPIPRLLHLSSGSSHFSMAMRMAEKSAALRFFPMVPVLRLRPHCFTQRALAQGLQRAVRYRDPEGRWQCEWLAALRPSADFI